TDIAVALCERLAEARADVLVAPAVAYGSSGEHQGFPGTLSIGQEALGLLLVELGRAASVTFAHLVFVCARGRNSEPAGRAPAREVVRCGGGGGGEREAGGPERGMMLPLAPGGGRLASGVPGDPRPLAEIWPLLRAGGVRAVSETGVLGDPSGATAGAGRTLLDTLSATLIREVSAWHPEKPA